MKAKIIKGKYKGLIVDVHQWCNDWFLVEHKDIPMLSVKPYSPTSLAFDKETFNTVVNHKNNGMLLAWFYPTSYKGDDTFAFTFKKINWRKR